jgi:hypothetical protein
VLRRGEVGCGVAGLQSARGRGAEREEPDEQQRQRRQRRRPDGEQRAGDREGVPGGEAGAPAGAVTDPRQRDSEDGCPEDAGRLTEAGRGVGAGDVTGEQAADRDPDGHPEAGERDARAEHPDGAALDRDLVDGGRPVLGHGFSWARRMCRILPEPAVGQSAPLRYARNRSTTNARGEAGGGRTPSSSGKA